MSYHFIAGVSKRHSNRLLASSKEEETSPPSKKQAGDAQTVNSPVPVHVHVDSDVDQDVSDPAHSAHDLLTEQCSLPVQDEIETDSEDEC